MPCYSPLKGWRSKSVTPNGKYPVTFQRKNAYLDLPMEVPCGQCIGCRLERSRQWAMRCVHEASLYDNNCFITLTYSDDHLPSPPSLCLPHFQKFLKRLRKKYGPDIRFFHCGEYGDLTRRPHYHAILFNHDFPDKILWSQRQEHRVYRSEALEALWPYGFSEIGSVSFESAAYVARYVLKKINGEQADSHYQTIDPDTGEISRIAPEYTTMSRKPGIGRGWWEKFRGDVQPHDRVVLRGMEMQPPKYYDRIYEIENPQKFEKMKAERKIEAKKYLDNNTSERLLCRKLVKEASLKSLPRPYL